MKKLISLLIIIMIVFGFVACGEGDGGAQGTTLSNMPASMQTFVYFNPNNMKKIGTIGDMWEQSVPAEYRDILDNIDEVYFATEAIEQDALNNMDNPMAAAGDMDFVAILKGEYDKDTITTTLGDEMNMNEKVSYDGIEGLRGSDGTLLFIDEKTMVVCTPDFAQTVINAMVKGENTIDTNTPEYKAANSMKADAMWLIADLDFYGKVNFDELGMVGAMFGLKGETGFGITTLGLSVKDESMTLGISTEVDSQEISDSISSGLNTQLDQFKDADLSQMFGLPPEIAGDVQDIVKNTRFKTDGKEISTSITVRESTIQMLTSMFGAGM